MTMKATKTPKQTTFNTEAEFEKAVLEHLTKVLPAAVHEAVHACLVRNVLAQGGAAPSERKIQNGVREPKHGGKCYTVWAKLDTMRSAGMEPTLPEVIAMAHAEGWNANNTRIEYYNWRRFHGYGAPAKKVERRGTDRRVKQVKLKRGFKNRRVSERRMAA
jgi:hypothetical protein